MNDLHSVVRNLKMFLEPLAGLLQLKTIALSINADLYLLDQERNAPRDRAEWEEEPSESEIEVAIKNHTVYTAEDYIEGLQYVEAHPRWNIVCLDSAEDYPIDPRAFSGLISNGQDHLLRWLHQRFSWNPVFTWACNMRHDHLNSEDYEDDDRHQPDQPFSDISPETRESHIASCRALFHAIEDIGAPVQLLLPGHRGNGMLFDPVHGYGDFRPSCRIWPTADISEWYLNSIGDLVDDLRILEGDDAPDFTDHLVDFERRSTMKQFREWEREELEFEKECSSKLWRELANIFPNLTRLQVHVLADIYPAKDDDDFIATVLPGKGLDAQAPQRRI